ncbi:MAG: four helix bundle protein [Bacteroidales bacterium]|nr:four helix bundle protein [Bacteroidales bacterium]
MTLDKRNKRELLENRLIDFAISVNLMAELLPSTYLGKNMASQLSRSSTSPALNYGEAQAAESTKDFIHKMRIGLKELRETLVGLKIIDRGALISNDKNLISLQKEADELISIFVSSINTATKRL